MQYKQSAKDTALMIWEYSIEAAVSTRCMASNKQETVVFAGLTNHAHDQSGGRADLRG